jgi:diguanylate cyclase (GGDEF)-like protein/PAS domain S-box-containing protein
MAPDSRDAQILAAENAMLRRNLAELEQQYAQCLLTEQSLRQREERYRRLVESVADYVYTVQVEDGRAVSTVHGPNCVAVTGYTAQEYLDNPLLWLTMVPKEDRPAVLEHAQRVIEGDATPIEHRIVHKDGTVRFVRNTPVLHRNVSGVLVSYDGIINDITERRRAEELVTRMSLHDGLTGLPNRAMFMDRLRQTLRLAQTTREPAAIYFIDLDKFKDVNDAYGHEVGDKVLQEAASRLAACVRRSDTVARLGGDEFVALTPGIGAAAQAGQVAGKMVAVLHKPFSVQGLLCRIGASVGVALFPEDGVHAGELLRRADAAMYAAKNAGRNGWRMAGDVSTEQSEKSPPQIIQGP